MASFPARDREELRNIINSMDAINPLISMMIEFEVRTGLRYVDISKLKFSDVMVNGVIRSSFTVVQSKGYNGRISKALYKATVKGKELTGDQDYQLSEEQAEGIRKATHSGAREASKITIHVNDALKNLIQRVHDANGKYALMFQSTHHHAKLGSAISIQYINRVYKRVATQLELPYQLSTHSMRKSFAMILLDNDASIKVIKDALGHSSVAVTDHYLRTFHDEAKKFTTGINF